MGDLNYFQLLDNVELECVNGGGLVEDIGWGCHYVYDKACQAVEWVKEQFK